MKNLRYTITFYSNWHCGSGQAAGADVDELVVKDRDGLPYVPGRTIKGLLRDAADMLLRYDGLDKDHVNTIFGHDDDNGKHGELTTLGQSFFSNAELPEDERATIIEQKLTLYLYKSVSSTAIDDDGIAKDLSLRKIQTVVPCKLEGSIRNVPEDMTGDVEKMVKLVKRLGLGRSHGLGRCKMEIEKEK